MGPIVQLPIIVGDDRCGLKQRGTAAGGKAFVAIRSGAVVQHLFVLFSDPMSVSDQLSY